MAMEAEAQAPSLPLAKRPKLSAMDDSPAGAAPMPSPYSSPVSLTFTLNVISCGFCKEVLVSCIYQCRNHHLVCAHCRNTERRWCSCPGTVESFRNEALERLVGCFSVLCSNSSLGCTGAFPIYERRAHESKCFFSPRRCACCSFTGAASQFSSHFSDHHRWSIVEVSDYNVEFGMALKAGEERAVVPVLVGSSRAMFLIHLEQHGSSSRLFASQVARQQPGEEVRVRISVFRGREELWMKCVPKSMAKARETGLYLCVPESCNLPDGRIQIECCVKRS